MATKAKSSKSKGKGKGKSKNNSSSSRISKKTGKSNTIGKTKAKKSSAKSGQARINIRSKTKRSTKAKAQKSAQIKTRVKTKRASKAGAKAKSTSRNARKKTAKILAIPRGYRSITPYLTIKGAAKAIDFYKAVFGATEKFRMEGPHNTISHAEIMIGDSVIMLGDERPEMNVQGPFGVGGTPVGMHLYLEDVDAVVSSALAAGAILERPVTDMFYGDRSGSIVDPFGHKWCISTHIEDVEPAEIERRVASMGKA